MNWKPVNNHKKESAYSLLAKSKSASILQTKPSKPSLTPTLTTISSINSKKSPYQKENISNEYFKQCGELPIESKLVQNNSYFDYYPPQACELRRRRIQIVSTNTVVISTQKAKFYLEKWVTHQKISNLSITKRSKSNTSILNRSIQKDEKLGLPCDQVNASVLNKFKAILLEMENKRSKAKQGNNEEKFTDSMFPPVYSSLFTVQKTNAINKKQIGAQIVWKRIPMVFQGKKLILKKTIQQSSNLTISSGKYSSQYFAQILQAIKNCDLLLAEYFRDHIPNQFGVYCLRIFTENGWRRIIVDDFIPVIRIEVPKEEYIPAFTNIKSTIANPYRAKSLEIWPFLLEKAYASYYSTYQALKYGKKIDFLQQITGSTLQDKPTNHQQKHNSICIQCEELSNQYQQKQIERKIIKFIQFRKSIIKLSKITPPKQVPKKMRSDIFVRKVTIGSCSDLSIMIRQKDERFYHHSAVLYSYIWIRAVFLYKEYSGGYTWIDGKYSNRKSINFSILNAKPGEYFIVVMPQWKSIHRHQISLIVSSESQPFQLQTVIYKEQERMFEKGCSDLAQRFGTLHQINKITCAYKFIHPECGLIIESIHNERISGEIVVQREWRPSEKSLIPFNPEFGAMNQRKKIEVLIEKNNQYSLVIMEINGRASDLLKYNF